MLLSLHTASSEGKWKEKRGRGEAKKSKGSQREGRARETGEADEEEEIAGGQHR